MALNLQGDSHIDALPYVDQGYEDPGVREAVREIDSFRFYLVRTVGFCRLCT